MLRDWEAGSRPTCSVSPSVTRETACRLSARQRHDRKHAAVIRDEWKTSAAVFLPGGGVPAPGSLFTRPRSPTPMSGQAAKRSEARASRALTASGRRGTAASWRRRSTGSFARRTCSTSRVSIIEACSEPRTSRAGRQRWKIPSTTTRRPHRAEMRPLESGAGFLQQLALLRGFDIGAMDPLGAGFIHTVVECKLAFADREAYYGDPGVRAIRLGALLDDGYNDVRRKLVGREASLELRPGMMHGFTPWVDHDAAARAPLAPSVAGTGEPTISRLGVIGAIRATSMSSTAGATWSARPPQAAGCNPRRSSRNSASAWVRAGRCSG